MLYFLLGVLIIVFILWLYAREPFRSLAHIPGPTPTLFLGDIKAFATTNYFIVHDNFVKKYGPVSKHYIGRKPHVLVSDPQLIKEMTVSNFDTFHNRPINAVRRVRQSTSLLFAQDEYWRRLRRTMSPTFNAAQMKNMIPHIENQLKVFLAKMEEAASTSAVVNIHSLIGRLTLDIIGSVAFGANLNVQKDEKSELVEAATTLLRNSLAVNQGNEGWSRILTVMFPFMGPLLGRLFPSEAEKIVLKSALIMDSYSKKLLEKRKEEKDNKKIKEKDKDNDEEENNNKKDFLDLLLNATDPDTGIGLTDREIIDQSNLFLLAGHETTANMITSTIYLLAQHPEIDEALSKECQELEEISYTSIREMKLMNMVIKESLRLYPPAVVIRREACEDTNLGGHFIPKGTWTVVPIWSMHYDESYWKDAKSFKPIERWSENKGKQHAYHWLPFGAGPHGCIGERFAVMEGALILSQILKKFRFELEPGQIPLELKPSITISPKNGVHVKVYLRK